MGVLAHLVLSPGPQGLHPCQARVEMERTGRGTARGLWGPHQGHPELNTPDSQSGFVSPSPSLWVRHHWSGPAQLWAVSSGPCPLLFSQGLAFALAPGWAVSWLRLAPTTPRPASVLGITWAGSASGQ